MASMIEISVRVPPPLHEQLRRAAYEQHLSQNAIIRAALTDWLTRDDPAEHDTTDKLRTVVAS